MENGNAPATKADLQELEVRIDDRFHAFEERMVELIRESETPLLKAFYGFAESNQKRLSAIESENAAVTSRLSTIENRLTEVEKRLNMPPQN